MNLLEQDAIVVCAIQSLKSEGSWTGETHVQKALYLCQEIARVPSNFKFVLYKHGPYSFQLSERLQGLIADDLVYLQTRPPYGPTLGVSTEGRSVAASIDRNGDITKRIAFISKKLGGKGVAELEKLATAVYVDRKYGAQTTVEKRVEILTAIKPHVAAEAAQDAFAEAEAIREEAHRIFAN